MNTTLIVTYLPRGNDSNTKKLLDVFKASIKNSTIEELNLLINTPDLLLENNIAAYIKKYFLGNDLNPVEQGYLKKSEKMADQFLDADVIVFAFPMYNFSMPAVVKAYFDAIMLKGKTFNIADATRNEAMKNKQIVILLSSAGIYNAEKGNLFQEHAISLAKVQLNFMGINNVSVVHLGGTSLPNAPSLINNALLETTSIAKKIYS